MFSSWPNSNGMWRVTKKFFDLPHSRLQSLFLVHRGSRSQLLCLIHWISYRWSSLLMTARSHFPSQKAACPTQEHICPSFQHQCCPALFIGPTEGRCQHFVQLESPDTPEPVRCWLGQSFLGGLHHYRVHGNTARFASVQLRPSLEIKIIVLTHWSRSRMNWRGTTSRASNGTSTKWFKHSRFKQIYVALV